jgi:hypothetical protein
MKWTFPLPPKNGDTRIRTKFAFLPKKFPRYRTVVWWEKYNVEERFQDGKWIHIATFPDGWARGASRYD